jgi:DNA-binding NarL/FixJ family response regulator
MLSLEEAVTEALAVEVRPRDPASADRRSRLAAGILTERKREVVTLLLRGLTNRQIAADLVVTERTVAAHIEHILAKLGFVSRTQIAVWAAHQEKPTPIR